MFPLRMPIHVTLYYTKLVINSMGFYRLSTVIHEQGAMAFEEGGNSANDMDYDVAEVSGAADRNYFDTQTKKAEDPKKLVKPKKEEAEQTNPDYGIAGRDQAAAERGDKTTKRMTA